MCHETVQQCPSEGANALIHGLQGFHNKTISIPNEKHGDPALMFLEERYILFNRVG